MERNKTTKEEFEKAKPILISLRKQLSKLGGRHLAIFGSIVGNEATKKSDIDILVDFDTKKNLFGLIDLKLSGGSTKL